MDEIEALSRRPDQRVRERTQAARQSVRPRRRSSAAPQPASSILNAVAFALSQSLDLRDILQLLSCSEPNRYRCGRRILEQHHIHSSLR
jgi:hypothetical protein